MNPPTFQNFSSPTHEPDILSNIPKRIPQAIYPFGVYQWTNYISGRIHLILKDGICEERQAVYYFLLLKPVKESLIHQTEIGEDL